MKTEPYVWVVEMLVGKKWETVEECRDDRRRARYLIKDWTKMCPERRYRVAKYERVKP